VVHFTLKIYTDVLNSLANGIVNMTGGAKGTLSQLNSTSGPLYAALNSFITNKDGTVAGQPRAYLNWILLDNQFNYVSSYPQSGAIPVSNFTMGTLGTPGYSGIPITIRAKLILMAKATKTSRQPIKSSHNNLTIFKYDLANDRLVQT
jgi:hypothetical protein